MPFLSPSVSIKVADKKSVSTERYGLVLLQCERSAKPSAKMTLLSL